MSDMNIIDAIMPSIIGLSQKQLFEDYSGVSILTARTASTNNNVVQNGADYSIPTYSSNITWHVFGSGLALPNKKTLEIELSGACRFAVGIFTGSLQIPSGSTMTNLYGTVNEYTLDPDTQQKSVTTLGRTRMSGISDNYHHAMSVSGCIGSFSITNPNAAKTIGFAVQSGIAVTDATLTVVAFA